LGPRAARFAARVLVPLFRLWPCVAYVRCPPPAREKLTYACRATARSERASARAFDNAVLSTAVRTQELSLLARVECRDAGRRLDGLQRDCALTVTGDRTSRTNRACSRSQGLFDCGKKKSCSCVFLVKFLRDFYEIHAFQTDLDREVSGSQAPAPCQRILRMTGKKK